MLKFRRLYYIRHLDFSRAEIWTLIFGARVCALKHYTTPCCLSMSFIIEEPTKEDNGTCLLHSYYMGGSLNICYITWHNPGKIKHILQTRKPRLREFNNLCRVAKLLNDGCYFKLRSFWLISLCTLFPIYDILYSHLSLHIKTFSLFQTLGYYLPA